MKTPRLILVTVAFQVMAIQLMALTAVAAISVAAVIFRVGRGK